VDILIYEYGSVRSVDTVMFQDTGERFAMSSIDDPSSYMSYIKDQIAFVKEQNPEVKVVLMLSDSLKNIFFVQEVEEYDGEAKKFVDYLVPVIDALGFDGIDIDWEFPNKYGDSPNELKMHTSLLKNFREKFDELEEETGKHYLLSISACSGAWGFEKNELYISQVYLDYVNIMSYDIAAGGHTTMHHAAPRATKVPNGVPLNNLEDNLVYFMKNRVPGSKILGGVGFDSRSWTSESLKNLSGDLPGLGVYVGEEARYSGLALLQINGMIDNGGWKRYFDPDAKAPYLYNAESGGFLTYEDEGSALEKCRLSKDYNTAGLMIFTYRKISDTPGIIAAMRAELDS
ncbi:MAG: hypothetical protein IJT91_01935, partial [Clostridia bacterium]|nr:hypothetical protein [Clostridia bacterium]